MKISTKRDALFAQLQTVTRAASTRSAVQALSGVHLRASGGAIELRATDMEIGLRVPLEGEVVRDGAVVLPARLLVDVVRALPADDVTLELRPSEQDVELVGGAATFHIRTLRLEDFPPFPETEAEGRVQVPGPAFVETVLEGRPVGVARRDAAGAHRHPRLRFGRGAADGRDRLLPPVGQGDAARRAARGLLRGQRAGAGAAGADADRPARRRGPARRVGAREPGRLRGRRRRPVLAADRRPVPQLPPAAPRRLRARAAAGRRRRSPRSCAASRCWRRRTRRCGWRSRRGS